MRGMGGMPDGAMRGMGGMQNGPMGSGIISEVRKRITGSPFSMSGGFSTTALDGWTGGGSRSTGTFRSSPSSLSVANGALRSLLIPAAVAKRTKITAGIWSSPGADSSVVRVFGYQIGSGSQVVGASPASSTSGTFVYSEFSFDNPGEDDVTIFAGCSAAAGAFFDDWTVDGVAL